MAWKLSNNSLGFKGLRVEGLTALRSTTTLTHSRASTQRLLCGFLLGIRPAPTGLVLQILPVESDEPGLTRELLPGAAALERCVVVIRLLSLTGLWRSFHTQWKRRARNQRLPLASLRASWC